MTEQRTTTTDQDLSAALERALTKARELLLSHRNPQGIWVGELSSSALSTATAVVALALVRRAALPHDELRLVDCFQRGCVWLRNHANPDGGWGDTILSKSNISTTTLAWAVLADGHPAGPAGEPLECGVRSAGCGVSNLTVLSAAEKWLCEQAGGVEPERLAAKVLERYGSDRTFSAPILTHCALAGRLGEGPDAWRHVIALPFELAACPPEWFGALRLPVVSYALPALIAIGYARHYHAPSTNPLVRWLRSAITDRVLRVLDSIQPANGGFLEAIPLTSFVVMSLAGSGKADHPVARRGLDFILNSVQPDGSWRIDTNLSTFVSTLAVQSLGASVERLLSEGERRAIQDWLLAQQYRVRHPYTNAAPGGWAWTPLPGGVPDADDTAGALLALRNLRVPGVQVTEAARAGITWLLNLQNRDGGIPTFCRGWGKLPFDRSSADLTAHALRAWAAWEAEQAPTLIRRIESARKRAVRFLSRMQEPQGSWCPLWFGNQFEPDEANRVYGTSRVLLALAETQVAVACAQRAASWLKEVQKPDGGWSGGAGPGPSTIEETALAVESLLALLERCPQFRTDLAGPIRHGLAYLQSRVNAGSWTRPAPIGFYFAKLWYYETLYPVVFTVAALQRARDWGFA